MKAASNLYSVSGRKNALVRHVQHDEKGTSYRFVLSELPLEAARREGVGSGGVLLSLLSPVRGAYPIQKDGYLHWSYLLEKFPGLTQTDARILTEIVGEVLQRTVDQQDLPDEEGRE